jgi:glycosyltransferase involved in cell wall biosynthesis
MGERDFRMTLAGSLQFSEQELVERIQAADVRVVPDPDDEELESLYRSSAVLVMPSYHEGYCLPILEAFHAGCQVVAFDAANLPFIVGGLGQVVETGNVSALAQAMQLAMGSVRASKHPERCLVPTAAGELPLADWVCAVGAHLEQHSRERYNKAFLSLLDRIGVNLNANRVMERAA